MVMLFLNIKKHINFWSSGGQTRFSLAIDEKNKIKFVTGSHVCSVCLLLDADDPNTSHLLRM